MNRLQEEKDGYVRAEHILDHMHRRCDDDFARFRVALRNAQQEHILKYLERFSEPEPESESMDESTPTAVVVQPSEEQHQPTVTEDVRDEMAVEQQNEFVPQPPQPQQDQCEYRF